MADILIIRNKCDTATVYTNWIGDGLKAYLESKGHTVVDLSDAEASPKNVDEWLDYNSMKTTKAVIALDHGSPTAFYGEENNKTAQVITKTNAEKLTKELHVYTLACSTNGDGCVGQTAVDKGCYSWLGYTEPVYAMNYQPFKDCIWSYIEAMAAGKTIEQCEAALRKAYEDRKNLSFVFGYNLARLKLRKIHNNMTINSHNRGPKWYANRKVLATFAHNTTQWAFANIEGLGWRRIKTGNPDGVTSMFANFCEALANQHKVNVYADNSFVYTMYLLS